MVGKIMKTGIRGIAGLLLILLISSTCSMVTAATRYEMPANEETTVTEPPVILESGTAGSSVVYTNGTCASVTVDSLATTFYPNGYSIITGSLSSGSTPTSVSAVDSDYLTVDSAGTDTSSSSHHPSAYSPVGGTAYVSGSVENLSGDDGIRMVFQSYLSRDVDIEDAVDDDSSNVDSSPDRGSSSNFTAQRFGPDAVFDELTEEYFGGIIEDPVDNNDSDVDGSADRGAHSSFSDQQSGPDSAYDTLTEENTDGASYATGFKVQQGRTLLTSATQDIPITPVNSLERAFVLLTGYYAYGQKDAPPGSTNGVNSKNAQFNAYLSNTSNIRVSRGAASVDVWITWQVIECLNEEFLVYRGSQSYSGTTKTYTPSIGGTVNGSRCLAWANGATNDQSNRDFVNESMFTAEVGPGPQTTLTLKREAAGTAAGTVRWIVVEFDPEKIGGIQTGETIVTTQIESSRKTVSISPVDASSSILLFQIRGSGNGLMQLAIAGALDSNTQISFYAHKSNSFTRYIRWYVIDFGGSSGVKQSGQIDKSGDANWYDIDQTLTTINRSRAISFVSLTCDGTGTAFPRPFPNAYVENATNLNIWRSHYGQESWIEWQVLELPYSVVTDNYELDLEVQWTESVYFLQDSYLCIRTGSFSGSEDLRVDCWDVGASQWMNLGTLASNSWNNFSIAAYLTTSTFTVRFEGAKESRDPIQNTWQIDVSLVKSLGSGGSEDAVDNNTSDVDGSADRGAHSSFADQQSGPDGSYDTLSEENMVSNWWSPDYKSRRRLNITTSPTLLSGYSVSFTVDTTGADFQDDGDDLRIIYWNGTGFQELDRINTTPFNSPSTEVWFATVSQIPSGGYDDNYYLYYGNPAASNPPANRSKVYLWWDDFSTDTLGKYDLAKWVDIHGADTYYATPTYDAANERVTFDTGDNYASDMYPKGIDVADALISVTFWADLNYPTEATVALISRLNNPGTTSTHYYYHFSHGSYTSPGGSYNSWTNGERNTLMYSPPSNSYWTFNEVHNLTYIAYGTSHKLWYDEKPDDTPLASGTHTGETGSGRWGWAPAQVRGWVDDILIRRYVDPEPTVSVGPPESPNYRIDLEIQWTNVIHILPHEELCIYTGSTGGEDLRVEIWNTTSSSWDPLLSDLAPNAWNNVSIAGWLTGDTVTVRFKGADKTNDTTLDQWQIDVALIHVWSTDTARYRLDLEVQWTNVGSDEYNELLCIYAGTMGAEDLRVDVWYNNGWQNLLADLSTGWNNVSVGSYLTSSTFTIRFKGGSDASDIVQDTWQIDVSLLHVWTVEYTAEVEFSGESNLYDWTQLSWTVDSSWTVGSVQVTLQLYNYTGPAYPDGGDGHIGYTSVAADIDETKNEVVASNPEDFRNATGGWRIKVKGVSYAETQFNLKVDLVEAAPTYYSEYTASTELLFDDVTDNGSPSLNFTVVSHNGLDGAAVTIQVWNYTTSSYATSGQGYLSYTSTGVNVTKHLNITANPASCLDGSNAKIRITAVLSTTSPFQQLINYVRLLQAEKQLSYDYVLNVRNQVADPWKARLRAYGETDIGRLLNCTISLNESKQIVVLDGAYSQDAGPWIDLPASGAIRIVVDISAETTGTSLLQIHLEIREPGTTTYTSHVIHLQVD